jgi:hypothetical protein
VQPTGAISFRSRYAGKRRKLGDYGSREHQISLRQAREAALAIKASRGAVPDALAAVLPSVAALREGAQTVEDCYRFYMADVSGILLRLLWSKGGGCSNRI